MRQLVFLSAALCGFFLDVATGCAGDAPNPGGAPSPMKLVRQALDADLAGKKEQRVELLRQALQSAPLYAPARWHNGEMLVVDQWLPVRHAQQQAAENAALKQYRQLRDRGDGSVAAHTALASWCRKQQWRDREEFHWRIVLQLQPRNKEARAALQLQEYQGVWLTAAEIALYKELSARAARNFERWQRELAELRQDIDGQDSSRQGEAVARLKEIREPASIPALAHSLSQPSAPYAAAAVAALASIQEQASTDVLTWQAVASPYAEVRQAAIEALRSRPWHSFVPTLVGSLTSPLELTYYINATSPGEVQYGYQLFRDGPFSQAALTNSTNSEIFRTSHTPLVAHPGYRDARTAQLRAAANERGLVQQQVDAANQVTQWQNERLYAALEQTTGEKHPANPQAWWSWWEEYNGLYIAGDKPVRSSHAYRRQTVRFNDQPRALGGMLEPRPMNLAATGTNDRRIVPGTERRLGQGSHHGCCFIPGTLVWTETGLEPIERLRPGDQVLSQDPESGELTFRFVQGIAQRPATSTRRITVGSDTVIATLGHPFWTAGQGWRMVKQLQGSDRLYTLEGCVPISLLEDGPDWEAHSLAIEGFGTYFVGQTGLLVKDNKLGESLVTPLPGYRVVAAD